jgi:hypothetical protein
MTIQSAKVVISEENGKSTRSNGLANDFNAPRCKLSGRTFQELLDDYDVLVQLLLRLAESAFRIRQLLFKLFFTEKKILDVLIGCGLSFQCIVRMFILWWQPSMD